MSDEPQKDYWIAMLRKMDTSDDPSNRDEYFVLCDKNGAITDYESLEKGLQFFTGAYDRAHLRGQQGTASAFFMQALGQPRIVNVDQSDLSERLFDEKAGIKRGRLNSIGAFLNVLICNGSYERIQEVYSKGTKPEFSSPELKSMMR